MVDNGATSSVLNKDMYKGPLRKSDPSMGINGVLTKTYKMSALPIETVDGEYIMDHTFSIIPDCPVSLLGRDLFVKLDLGVTKKKIRTKYSLSHHAHSDPGYMYFC